MQIEHEWNWLPNSDSKQIVMTSHHAKNQLDSSRRSSYPIVKKNRDCERCRLSMSEIGISNLFYVVFGSLLAPTPNFIKIGWKTQKLKIFTKGSQCPMPVCMREIGSRIRILFRGLTITSVQNLNKIGWKLAELAHREIFSQKLEIVRGADWTNTKIEK